MLTKNEITKRVNKMYNSDKGMIDHDLHLDWSKEELEILWKFYAKGVSYSAINFSNKSVLDYGCGGGWLGKYLLEKYFIKRYIGIDVAQRSIDFAKNNLPKSKAQVIKIEPWEMLKPISRKKIDILVCVACMQHFPTQEYLDEWLNQVNNLKLEWVILQFHFHETSGGKTLFRENPYGSIRDVAYACYTTLEYISNKLTNYELIDHRENIGKRERNFGYFRKVG